MQIAAIFGLLEKIRPTIEREYIYIYIYILLRICMYSLFSRENWEFLFFMQSIVDLFTFSFNMKMEIKVKCLYSKL